MTGLGGQVRTVAADHAVIEAEKVRLLYQQAPMALLGAFVVGCVVALGLWGTEGADWLLKWVLALAVVTLARLLLVRAYERRGAAGDAVEPWRRRYVVGAFVGGAVWGSAGIFLDFDWAVMHQLLLLCSLCGVAIGAISSNVVVLPAYLAFLVPVMTPFAIRVLAFDDTAHTALGLLAVVFMGSLGFIARSHHASFRQSLGLRQENRHLLDDLYNTNAELQAEIRERQSEVHERRQAERQLRLAATVFETTAEGVVIIDTALKTVAVNRAFQDITGYSRDEVLGKETFLLYSAREEEASFTSIWSAMEQDGRWQGELWQRRRNGELYPVWLTVSLVRNDEGRVSHYVAVFSDISVIKESQQQLDYLAHHDRLTGLPNRLLFDDRLRHAMAHARREGSVIALLFLDLDRFKYINDTLGHPAGDDLLRQVAGRLSACVRAEDTVARLGGDELTVLLEGVHGPDDAAGVAAEILQALARPFALEGREVFISASIGIGLFPQDGEDVTMLVKNADAAMYRAKEEGGNTYQFYTPALTTRAVERLALETSLRQALERDQFMLHYQPQVSLASGEVTGVEALLRWQHPQYGLLEPERFISVAEETGLLDSISHWVLGETCAQIRRWRQAGVQVPPVAVNICGRLIVRAGFVERIEAILARFDLPAQVLELEITEGSIMQHAEQAVANIDALKRLGVRLSIDDFGTGYSSMSYLKRLSVDRLKIDRAFVRELPVNANDVAITRAVIALAHGLQLEVLAEGVETEAQRDFLAAEGCDEFQGYLFSPAVPPAELARFLPARSPGAVAATLGN